MIPTRLLSTVICNNNNQLPNLTYFFTRLINLNIS